MISVVILGAGNVATHLFKGFSKTSEVSVVQWYNRSLSAIQAYGNVVDVTDDLSTLKDADVYILAVSDDVISDLSSKLPFENKLVVHTSGSASVYDIDMKHKRGVLYPLQSISKDADIDFANVPICIETIDKACFPILKKLTLSLGSPIKRINSDQRRVLHLAAVFCE